MFFFRGRPSASTANNSRSLSIKAGQAENGSGDYCSNAISTGRYTAFSFVPKNLFEQFTQPTNAYFLFLIILQCMPLTPSQSRFPPTAVPLVFVTLINGVKDGYEDFKRHRSDRAENTSQASVIEIETIGESVQLILEKRKQSTDLSQEVLEKVEREELLCQDAHAFTKSRRFSRPALSDQEELTDDGLSTTSSTGADENAEVERFNFRQKPWQDLAVGDLIVLYAGDSIPADALVLIASSKTVFVETSSLDGETSLKTKEGVNEIQMLLTSPDSSLSLQDIALRIARCDLNLECESPSPNIESFAGVIRIGDEGFPPEKWREATRSSSPYVELPLRYEQLILRGCKVAHTDWLIAAVMYTGRETKIRLNSIRPVRKYSKVEKRVSKIVWILSIFIHVLCLTIGVATTTIDHAEKFQKYKYLHRFSDKRHSFAFDLLLNYLRWVVFIGSAIPISLLVTLNVVKAAQGWHMGIDRAMYDRKRRLYATVKSSALNEELGQVSYVLTDKTGTLTSNVLTFRRCAIGSIVYRDEEEQPTCTDSMVDGDEGVAKKTRPHVRCESKLLREALSGRGGKCERSEALLFLLNLAINNTLMVAKREQTQSYPSYIASSPDEEAFANFAACYNVVFTERGMNQIIVNLFGENHVLKVIGIAPFTSERRRSSIVIEMSRETGRFIFDKDEGEKIYILFAKGADSAIEKLCDKSTIQKSTQCEMFLSLSRNFAEDCLRTVGLAYKVLPLSDMESWMTRYKAAGLELHNREETMLRLMDSLEHDLETSGVTGIEDKLAPNVPETVQSLRLAGIKIWMLTGDRFETAFNVALGSSLMTLDSSTVFLTDTAIFPSRLPMSRPSSRGEHIREVLEGVLQGLTTASSSDFRKANPLLIHAKSTTESYEKGLVSFWEGDILSSCLDSPELSTLLYQICRRCTAVVFFRVAPQRKGDVVRLLRKFEDGSVTLAVGDGGNDCNMIQSAHVGVGIRGREGLQAFNVSDYGLAQFRHLNTLILVHGRWNYRRICIVVLFTLYRSFLFALLPLFTLPSTMFAGASFMPLMYKMFFNITLTQPVTTVFGIWDQDITRDLILKFPQLYKSGPRNVHLSWLKIVVWSVELIWHLWIIITVPWVAMGGTRITSPGDGIPNDAAVVANVMFLQMLIIMNGKILFQMRSMNWILMVAFFFSFETYFVLLHIMSVIPSIFPDSTGILFRLIRMPIIWVVTLICVLIAFSLDLSVRIFTRSFRPQLSHLVQFLVQVEMVEQKRSKEIFVEAVKQGGHRLLERINTRPRIPTADEPAFAPYHTGGSSISVNYKFTESDDEIREALKTHDKNLAADLPIKTIVMDILNIKPFTPTRGGFAFAAGNTSAELLDCHDTIADTRLSHQGSYSSRTSM